MSYIDVPISRYFSPSTQFIGISLQKNPSLHVDPRTTPLVEGVDLDYYANELASPRNMREHVQQILIPRVSGTQGNKQVREVSCVLRIFQLF